jgi:glutamate transport system substrate-binding protein
MRLTRTATRPSGRTALATGACAAVLVLSACGGGGGEEAAAPAAPVEEAPEFEEGSTMATIAEEGRIQIGTKFDQPGFGLTNLEGDPEGFDVEIATYIAGQLGLEPDAIEWVEAPSAERENLIESGKVDLVVATYTINDLRKERITFAGPYYLAGQQIMVNAGDTTISGPDDLKANPDFTICSVVGSTPAENIRPYLAAPEQLVEFEGYDDCVTAMQNGQVKATTTDNVILTGYVAENEGEFELVGEQFTDEPYGIGLEKGDVAFCEFVNEALASAAEDGAYEEAWTSTAGQYEGTEVPTLPEADPCV